MWVIINTSVLNISFKVMNFLCSKRVAAVLFHVQNIYFQ